MKREGVKRKNGEAPQQSGGAFRAPRTLEPPAIIERVRRRRTTFPPEAKNDSLRTLLYNAYRHEFSGAPLTRWLIIGLIALAIFWMTGLPPGRWWVGGAALLLALILIVTIVITRRRDFVRFEESSPPVVAAAQLDPADKIPVNVTGYFSVEGQYARYTWLPGFYRTFATREHALLCLVRNRRFLRIGRWPGYQTGMWYVFFTPEMMRRIRYGRLHFGRKAAPAIAVDYEFVIPKSGRFQRDQQVEETVYIACQNEEDARRIWADLIVEEIGEIRD